MSLRDITRDDVLHAFGLEARRTMSDYVLPGLGIFGAGLLVGAGLGLLLAPKTGPDLRADVGQRARNVVSKIRNIRRRGEDNDVDNDNDVSSASSDI